MSKSLLLCNCLGSQSLDQEALSENTSFACSKVHNELCGREAETVAAALESGDVAIACGQESAFFAELAEDLNVPAPLCIDIRDRAGWTKDTAATTPKMAALLAEALLASAPAKTMDVSSEGLCLILGEPDVTIPAAEQLCEVLAVTVLLPPDAAPFPDQRFDTVAGTLKSARGAFTEFEVQIEDLREPQKGGRGELDFGPVLGRGTTTCDIILDLTGNTPLFPAHEKRDGYLRADPKHAPSIASAIFDAAQLIGTFEKELFLRLTEPLCAHSRAQQTGCSNCIDICPTGAITPAGDHVAIDPMVCAGCGSCASLCPSGAIEYESPTSSEVFRRIETLARTFLDVGLEAGGKAPRLLVHDNQFGTELLRTFARYGDGLPADVIPLEVSALSTFGHAETLAALATGFVAVDILLAPKTETEALEREASTANAIASNSSVRLISVTDPDDLSELLYADTSAVPEVSPILPLGNRRQVTRLAAKSLNPEADIIELPDHAPYGAVTVDTDACTLCLSCVSLCPSGALGDNPDLPQLRFQEDACLQCGLCTNVCPESALTLEPRLNLDESALSQTVIHEEEPFACVSCGELFGVKSTIEKISEKLAGKHSMFASSEAARMIQMCDDCRVKTQMHSANNPFAGKERPPVRRSEDYFSKRKDH
ncbi:MULTISPECIES: 4Fe-4S binding protein [Halocynthiibacter]|uniref:4Fe-4S binding protein n=1 Tax=Halocynthiibacter halioticoli TaxID=2986804 RepID=A0AAE3LUP2_9RHOB|nr:MULTISPECIES: 4Fe-4S binding protein [Halocynthiibacter]MCV6825090.1 4Fe-4S binding protein [Halocynthiibacter halioticoli]MCW4058091.1 4Fe-4S binding protein [Halocynthiibacter sp. SDUM655004]